MKHKFTLRREPGGMFFRGGTTPDKWDLSICEDKLIKEFPGITSNCHEVSISVSTTRMAGGKKMKMDYYGGELDGVGGHALVYRTRNAIGALFEGHKFIYVKAKPLD